MAAVVQQQMFDALEAKDVPARVAGRRAAADQGEIAAGGIFCYSIGILLVRDGTTFLFTAILRCSSLCFLLLLLLLSALGPRAKANGTAVMFVIHRWWCVVGLKHDDFLGFGGCRLTRGAPSSLGLVFVAITAVQTAGGSFFAQIAPGEAAHD